MILRTVRCLLSHFHDERIYFIQLGHERAVAVHPKPTEEGMRAFGEDGGK